MKRLGGVLLFLLLAAAIFFGIFCYAERQQHQKEEEEQPVGRLVVYTSLPKGFVQIFDAPFYEGTGFRLTVEELSGGQILERLRQGVRPDLYLVSQDILHALEQEEALFPYVSDKTDTVLNDFKNESGAWTGVWINPGVFAVNTEFAALHPAFSYTWDEIFHRQSVRIVMTDCIAAEEAEDSLMALVENFGVEESFVRLRNAAPHVVQYGKYLSTPAHMAAMDKCDIGISGYNEARRVKEEGLPIRITYPEDGTYFYLYGAGIDRMSREKDAAALWIDWLLSGDGEALLSQNGYYYMYTNDTRLPEDDGGKKPLFWPLQKKYTAEGKKELLNRWIQEIRFGN